LIRYAAAALALMAGGAQDSSAVSEWAEVQVIVRQQIIVRVPPRVQQVPAASVPLRWREANGPRCVSARMIAGASPSQSSVDLVMRDNSRIRARLGQRCAGLDYYRGFYVNANTDGQLCAERDVIRSRMGGECEIVQFRTLQPVRP
jgi:hypothetical protein